MSFEVKDKSACDTMYAYAEERHGEAKRKTYNLLTSERHSYADSHLRGVANIVIDFVQRIPLPDEDHALLEEYGLDVLIVAAYLHDVLEDCEPLNCLNGSDCTEEHADELGSCKKLQQEVRGQMHMVCIDTKAIEEIMRTVLAVTKNKKVPHEDSRSEQAARLRPERFITKLLKFADNLHNLKTMRGKPFANAMKYYVDIRKAWEIMFTYEELIALYLAGMIEPPEDLMKFTVMFDVYQRMLSGREVSKEKIAEAEQYYQTLMTICSNPNNITFHINPSCIEGPPERKLENILSLAEGFQRPAFSIQAECELMNCLYMEKDKIMNLIMTFERGLQITREHIVAAAYGNEAIAHGASGHMEQGAVATAQSFLSTVGMSGVHFIEQIETEEQFEALIREKLLELGYDLGEYERMGLGVTPAIFTQF